MLESNFFFGGAGVCVASGLFFLNLFMHFVLPLDALNHLHSGCLLSLNLLLIAAEELFRLLTPISSPSGRNGEQ